MLAPDKNVSAAAVKQHLYTRAWIVQRQMNGAARAELPAPLNVVAVRHATKRTHTHSLTLYPTPQWALRTLLRLLVCIWPSGRTKVAHVSAQEYRRRRAELARSERARMVSKALSKGAAAAPRSGSRAISSNTIGSSTTSPGSREKETKPAVARRAQLKRIAGKVYRFVLVLVMWPPLLAWLLLLLVSTRVATNLLVGC